MTRKTTIKKATSKLEKTTTKTKPARKKTAADEAYNVRRRARREIARLDKLASDKSAPSLQRRAAREAASSLRDTVASTYSKANDPKERSRAFDKLSRNYGKDRPKAQAKAKADLAARNRVFERNMNLALQGKPSAIHKDPDKAQALAKAFMHRYTDERRGHRASEAYDIIRKASGKDDLQSIYQDFLKENGDIIRRMMDQMSNYDENGAMKDMSLMGYDEGDEKYMSITPYLSEIQLRVYNK